MNTLPAFTDQLTALKQAVDDELDTHIVRLRKTTAQQYTPYSARAVEAYVEILARGGKRIRGALTVMGYEMFGGTDRQLILQAASAIEMVHAYILVLDDIMDKSEMRRGGQSAHKLLASYHATRGLSGESLHFGEAVAINSALIGNHYAMGIMTGLQADDAYKLRALKLLNDTLVITGHGQVNDLFNEVLDQVSEADVSRVLEWKTAYYTFLNPLQIGMALAGADDETLESIRPYCMAAGHAFQITDDILGIFGSEIEAGKSPMDDIREGKRTLLSITALARAESGDKNFLIQMLGNEKLTQAEFNRCKEIFVSTGALQYASDRAAEYIQTAIDSLATVHADVSAQGKDFLHMLVSSLQGRHA